VTQQARVRQQQKVEELCAASIRALAGEADLHFRGQRLHRGTQMLPRFAPHLHPSLDDDDFASFRGAADGLALRLAHSDAELHARLLPSDPQQRLVFDLLEQIRVESLASEQMPGLRRNLRHRFEQWSLAYHHSGLNESARGLLLHTVAQMCRLRVTGEPLLEMTQDLIETTRGRVGARIGHDLLALRRQRQHQAAYAEHALRIAHVVAELIALHDDERDDQNNDKQRSTFNLLFDSEDDADEAFAVADSGISRVLNESTDGYRVFTCAHDRELDAATLVRPALLAEYRVRLDQRIAAQSINLARLARDMKALFAVPTRDGWDGAQEEGLVDGRRLAQLISTPTERRLFRIDRQQPVADCVVSFLIDCSGSMKTHIESVAMLIDVFVRTLDMAGVNSEVLGFTTGAWNGGRAARDWQRAGSPRHPGRLNEAMHLVFKSADTPWRRARPHIAALLKADLFREGIDGEAVDWACTRLQGRSEERRWLLVVSDGSPMDSATHRANDPHYLDHHLRDVVMRQEQSGGITICGIGVGLDLSPYYARSQALDLSAPPGNRVFAEILSMIAGHRRR
jgi:cobaltochelatase CobT